MLIRVYGKLTDDRSFSTRFDARDLFDAVAKTADAMKDEGVTPKQLAAKTLSGQSAIVIGKVRGPRKKQGKK